MREEDSPEGFTPSQEKQLRSRRKAQPEMTEGEKWFNVYAILFPDDDPQEAPSPCTYAQNFTATASATV